MSVFLSMRQVPPTFGALVRAKVFLLTASGRDLELGLHGGCERDKAKAEPALCLHFGETEEVVIGDVFHLVSFQRATSDYITLRKQHRR